MRRFLNPVKIPSAVSRILPGALAAVSLAMAGCLLQANYSASVTTADGVQIEVPLSRDPVVIDDGTVSVKRFQFAPLPLDKGKGLGFAFMLGFKEGTRPVAIAVDDVSDTPILSVYTDNAPKLSNKNTWSGGSPPRAPADDLVKWLMTLENCVKVYRFTVKLADGTTHVLRYPIFAPAAMKAYMRAQLGVG
jgi:hypothetical protein